MVATLFVLASCGGDREKPLPAGALARIDNNTVVLDVSRDDGFGPGEQIWYSEFGGKRSRAGIYGPHKLGYKYSADRDVFVEGMRGQSTGTMCQTSRVTGKRSCMMTTGLNLISFELSQGGVSRVCVISHDFPGRSARLRVDQGRIYTTGESGCLSGASARSIVAEARRGSVLNADYVEWPYEVRRETTATVGPTLDLALKLWSHVNGPRMQKSLFVADRSEAHMRQAAARNGM